MSSSNPVTAFASRQPPSAFRHILQTLGTQVLVLVLGIIGGVFVARILGPSGRGRYALLMMIPNLAFTFGNLGFGSAGTYYLNRGDLPRGQVVGSLYALGIFLALASAGAILVLHPQNISVWQDLPKPEILLAVLTTPFLFILNFSSRVLLGTGLIGQMNVIRLVQSASRVLVIVVLVGLLGYGVMGALFAFALSVGIGAAYGVTAGIKTVGRDFKVSPRFFVRGLSYGLPSFLILLANYLNHNFDVLMVKHYLDNTSVGLYTLVVAWVERLLYLPQSVGTVLFQRVASDEESGGRNLVMKSGRHSLAVVTIGALVLAACGHILIVGLYGSEFRDSIPALYCLLPAIVMLSLFQIYAVALAADGHPRVGAIGSVLSFVVNFYLNTVLIPRMGIVGAGLATTISYGMMSAIVVIAYKRRYDVPLREMLVLHRSEARASMERILRHLPIPGPKRS